MDKIGDVSVNQSQEQINIEPIHIEEHEQQAEMQGAQFLLNQNQVSNQKLDMKEYDLSYYLLQNKEHNEFLQNSCYKELITVDVEKVAQGSPMQMVVPPITSNERKRRIKEVRRYCDQGDEDTYTCWKSVSKSLLSRHISKYPDYREGLKKENFRPSRILFFLKDVNRNINGEPLTEQDRKNDEYNNKCVEAFSHNRYEERNPFLDDFVNEVCNARCSLDMFSPKYLSNNLAQALLLAFRATSIQDLIKVEANKSYFDNMPAEKLKLLNERINSMGTFCYLTTICASEKGINKEAINNPECNESDLLCKSIQVDKVIDMKNEMLKTFANQLKNSNEPIVGYVDQAYVNWRKEKSEKNIALINNTNVLAPPAQATRTAPAGNGVQTQAPNKSWKEKREEKRRDKVAKRLNPVADHLSYKIVENMKQYRANSESNYNFNSPGFINLCLLQYLPQYQKNAEGQPADEQANEIKNSANQLIKEFENKDAEKSELFTNIISDLATRNISLDSISYEHMSNNTNDMLATYQKEGQINEILSAKAKELNALPAWKKNFILARAKRSSTVCTAIQSKLNAKGVNISIAGANGTDEVFYNQTHKQISKSDAITNFQWQAAAAINKEAELKATLLEVEKEEQKAVAEGVAELVNNEQAINALISDNKLEDIKTIAPVEHLPDPLLEGIDKTGVEMINKISQHKTRTHDLIEEQRKKYYKHQVLIKAKSNSLDWGDKLLAAVAQKNCEKIERDINTLNRQRNLYHEAISFLTENKVVAKNKKIAMTTQMRMILKDVGIDPEQMIEERQKVVVSYDEEQRQKDREAIESCIKQAHYHNIILNSHCSDKVPVTKVTSKAKGQAVQKTPRVGFFQRIKNFFKKSEMQNYTINGDEYTYDMYNHLDSLRSMYSAQITPELSELIEESNVDKQVMASFIRTTGLYDYGVHSGSVWVQDYITGENAKFIKDYCSNKIENRMLYLEKITNELLSEKFSMDMFSHEYLSNHLVEVKLLSDRLLSFKKVYTDPINKPYFDSLTPEKIALINTRIIGSADPVNKMIMVSAMEKGLVVNNPDWVVTKERFLVDKDVVTYGKFDSLKEAAVRNMRSQLSKTSGLQLTQNYLHWHSLSTYSDDMNEAAKKRLPIIRAKKGAPIPPIKMQTPAKKSYKQRREERRLNKIAKSHHPNADHESLSMLRGLREYEPNYLDIYLDESNDPLTNELKLIEHYIHDEVMGPTSDKEAKVYEKNTRMLSDYDKGKRDELFNFAIDFYLRGNVNMNMFTDDYLIENPSNIAFFYQQHQAIGPFIEKNRDLFNKLPKWKQDIITLRLNHVSNKSCLALKSRYRAKGIDLDRMSYSEPKIYGSKLHDEAKNRTAKVKKNLEIYEQEKNKIMTAALENEIEQDDPLLLINSELRSELSRLKVRTTQLVSNQATGDAKEIADKLIVRNKEMTEISQRQSQRFLERNAFIYNNKSSNNLETKQLVEYAEKECKEIQYDFEILENQRNLCVTALNFFLGNAVESKNEEFPITAEVRMFLLDMGIAPEKIPY